MVDTDFEKDSRAHCFWEEWQAAADQAGDTDTYLDDLIAKATPQWAGVDVDAFIDKVRGREREPDDNDLTAYLSSISEDWAYVLKDNAND